MARLKYNKIPHLNAAKREEGLTIPKTMRTPIMSDKLAEQTVAANGVQPVHFSAALRVLPKLVMAGVMNGQAVRLPGLGNFNPSVFQNGTNEDGTPKLDVRLTFVPDSDLEKEVSMASADNLELVVDDKPRPVLVKVLNVATDEENKVLTAGAIAVLSGKYLKLNTTKTDNGLFLCRTNPETGVREEVKVALFNINRYSELGFQVPAELESGVSYELIVRANPGGCKDLRDGKLPVMLIIA